jgi:hypothetical protein
MMVCHFKTNRIDSPAIGTIQTRYDKYIHGCDTPTDAPIDASGVGVDGRVATLSSFRRVLLRDCKSIESHVHAPHVDVEWREAECFIHNELYIKQRNRRVWLGDYKTTMTRRTCTALTTIHRSLAGFAPFMRCLDLFIGELASGQAVGSMLSGDVDWRRLWLHQMYTTSVPSNEQVLQHCILRSANTPHYGNALIGRWYAHKARWVDEHAQDEASSTMHQACFVGEDGESKTRPFLVSLQPHADDETHLLLDADSTYIHGKSESKWDEMHIVRKHAGEGYPARWSITKYVLRLEVKLGLPFGYRVVDFQVSDESLKTRLNNAPLVACRYVNNEWFIGEVATSTNVEKCEYTVLYADYRPDSVSESTYEAQLALSNYYKDWVLVEKTTPVTPSHHCDR